VLRKDVVLPQYFEDFEVGTVNTSRARTVTEADIVNFAGLSGDFVELHTNEEYAKKGPFGRRIAHGLLVLSISSGLSVRMSDTSDTIIAFYGIDKLRFVKPTFIGDTVHVTKKVVDKQEKGPDRGVLTYETNVVNQNGEPVIVYTDKLMIKRRG
jgi:3-hydroxybutyryl-CoA dehydratase